MYIYIQKLTLRIKYTKYYKIHKYKMNIFLYMRFECCNIPIDIYRKEYIGSLHYPICTCNKTFKLQSNYFDESLTFTINNKYYENKIIKSGSKEVNINDYYAIKIFDHLKWNSYDHIIYYIKNIIMYGKLTIIYDNLIDINNLYNNIIEINEKILKDYNNHDKDTFLNIAITEKQKFDNTRKMTLCVPVFKYDLKNTNNTYICESKDFIYLIETHISQFEYVENKGEIHHKKYNYKIFSHSGFEKFLISYFSNNIKKKFHCIIFNIKSRMRIYDYIGLPSEKNKDFMDRLNFNGSNILYILKYNIIDKSNKIYKLTEEIESYRDIDGRLCEQILIDKKMNYVKNFVCKLMLLHGDVKMSKLIQFDIII